MAKEAPPTDPTPAADDPATDTQAQAKEVKVPMAYKYVGDGTFYFGIPAADITVAEYESLPPEHQALVHEVSEYRLWPGYKSPMAAQDDGGN